MKYNRMNRRAVMLAGVGSALVAPLLSSKAWTAPLPTAGDWFMQVKEQHVLIEAQLALVISSDSGPSAQRTIDLKQLSYLLTAHSVAEENVLYPALVFYGFKIDSGDLYLEQQFQKVMNAEIDNAAMKGADGFAFIEKVRKLSSAIHEHAKVHEEGDYYPKLQESMTADENALLSVQYREAYDMVKMP